MKVLVQVQILKLKINNAILITTIAEPFIEKKNLFFSAELEILFLGELQKKGERFRAFFSAAGSFEPALFFPPIKKGVPFFIGELF